MLQMTGMQKNWVDDQWEKLNHKLEKVAVRSRGKIPFASAEKMHDDQAKKEIYGWTNGFWPGLMWLMYVGTGNEEYKITAKIAEKQLDEALLIPEKLSHDVGFMWKLASGPDVQLTGDLESWRRVRRAADHLMARYNPVGGFIRAWNSEGSTINHAGWTIIDCLMNLPLLYWASEQVNDPRFKFAAISHTDKAMKYHVRPDGSVRHIVIYDPQTGEFLKDGGGQGFKQGSSWSRGQAWALYGFVLGYIYSGKEEYLETAKKIAHYFIACVCDDWLPKCDFRSPNEPVYYDSSAACCAACGMIEIAKAVPEYEKKVYLNAAMNILMAVESKFADWSEDTDFVITNSSTTAYQYEQNINIIYTDYFYTEAIYKLKGFEPLFW